MLSKKNLFLTTFLITRIFNIINKFRQIINFLSFYKNFYLKLSKVDLYGFEVNLKYYCIFFSKFISIWNLLKISRNLKKI